MSTTYHRYLGVCLYFKNSKLDKWKLSELVEENLAFYTKDNSINIDDGDIIAISNLLDDGLEWYEMDEQNYGFDFHEINTIDFDKLEKEFVEKFADEIKKFRDNQCDFEIKRVIFGYCL